MTEEVIPNFAAQDGLGVEAGGRMSDAPLAATVSPVELNDAAQAANTALISSRENIARATATVCFIYYYACSEHASPDNRAWFEAKWAHRKAEIEAHNRDIKDKKEAEKQRVKDDLQELKKKRREANHLDTQKALDDAIKARRDEQAERARVLDGQLKVKLETREGAEDYTGICKLILHLHSPNQASQVHRVAKGVKGLMSEWGPDRPPDIPAMTQFILERGGFEALYERQQGREGKTPRNKDSSAGGASTSEGNDDLSEEVIKHFQAAAASADSLGMLAFPHAHTPGSLVALIGRVGPDGIAVVSDIGMDAGEMLSLCLAKHEKRLLPGDPGGEFVAVTLSLGQLVDEGTKSVKGGGNVDITRWLSMSVDDEHRRLVVSASNIDSSVVVHAEPKGAAELLLPTPGLRRLLACDVETLNGRLADNVVRKMVTLRADTEYREVGDLMLPSDLAWTSTSGAPEAEGDPSAVLMHRWLAMSSAEASPLDVDRFHAAGTVTLSRDAVVALAKGKIGNWKREKSDSAVAEKKAAMAEVTFAKSTITARGTQGEDIVTGIGSVRGKVVLHFRPRPLARVVDALVRLNAGPVELSPDDRGALRFRFGDVNGCYSVFLPACGKDGTPLTAVFHPMRVPDTDD